MAIDQCVVPQGTVRSKLRPHVAGELVRIHCEATRAAPELVQVVFLDLPPGAATTSGQPSAMSKIAGTPRAGRPPQVRRQILERIHAAWTGLTGTPSEPVKITSFGGPTGWMMQDGGMMPDAGQDAAWRARRNPWAAGPAPAGGAVA